MNVDLCVTPPDNAAFRSEFTTGRRAAAAGGRQDRSAPLQMRRSTSMTPQSAVGSVCPLREPEGEIVLKFRTVPQASPLSLSAGVSLDPLVVEDPRRSANHVAWWPRTVWARAGSGSLTCGASRRPGGAWAAGPGPARHATSRLTEPAPSFEAVWAQQHARTDGRQGIQGALKVPVSLRIAVQSSPAQILLILPSLRR